MCRKRYQSNIKIKYIEGGTRESKCWRDWILIAHDKDAIVMRLLVTRSILTVHCVNRKLLEITTASH